MTAPEASASAAVPCSWSRTAPVIQIAMKIAGGPGERSPSGGQVNFTPNHVHDQGIPPTRPFQ